MTLTSTPAVIVYLAVLLALHILSALLPTAISKATAIINIVLHIGLILPLMYYAFPFSEAVLVYMISLTFYTALSFALYKSEERRIARTKSFFERYNSASDCEKEGEK